MSRSGDPIDEELRRSASRESMSLAEAEAVWDRVEKGVTDSDRVRDQVASRKSGPTVSHRLGLAGAVVAVAAIAIAVVSLGPWDQSGDSDGSFDLAGLGSASAAEVLGATADSARNHSSFVPGPGQVLYATEGNYFLPTAAETKVYPQLATAPPGPLPRYEKEWWIGPDGKGVEVQRIPDLTSMDEGSIEWATVDRVGLDVSRIGVDPEEGSEWPNSLTTGDLKQLPSDPQAALEFVRDAEDRAARTIGHWQKFSQKSAGKDLNVLLRTMSLLTNAPLTGEQRAALFEVIMTAPEWYRANGRSEVTIENRGPDTTVGGLEGIAIRVQMGEDPYLKRMSQRYGVNLGAARYFDLIVDPEAGRFLEMQGGMKGEPSTSWITFESLELRDIEEMPTPDRD